MTQSREAWHDGQVECMSVEINPVIDRVAETLLDKTSVDPMSGALALMAVRMAERYDDIGRAAGMTDSHRKTADLLIRKGGIRV